MEESQMDDALKKYGDLLSGGQKALAHLGTVMANGAPQVTPVWFDYDGKMFRVNSAKGRVKDRNMRRNPHVSLSIVDPANPYRYLGVQGRVVEITEQGADAHIDSLAKKYLGQDKYPYRRPDEVRVTYKIAPERTSGMG
jgi:PPOX class probable F420-dependent enzyme